MKIAVYNMYWPTFGGGEQQAGSIVDALSAEHEVELLGPKGFDLAHARERLGLRLDGVTYRVLPPEEYAATLASAEYEVFINHTYRSVAPNMSDCGIYFVMFPHDLDAGRRVAQVARKVGERVASPVRLLRGIGYFRHKLRVVGPVQVQVADGVQQVVVELSTERPERFRVASLDPVGPIETVVVDGVTRVSLPRGTRNAVIEPARMGEQLSPEKAPVLRSVHADGKEVDPSPGSVRQRLMPVRSRDFIPTYQRFVSLSQYTRTWTQQWWGADSDVVSPPVNMREAGTKEQLIVSVGRFFSPESGHSKRQLELVHAFRTLVEGGLTGWKLVLIGGASAENREYAMSVRAAAAGLPVEVRLSAPGTVLNEHLAAASIYWHAAGYGSDLATHPERAEHFGIAPIEAMSAGAVPIVFDAAGPAEVVHSGVDGLVYRTLDELVAHTRRVIEDQPYRERLAAAAVEAAHYYRRDRFEDEVRTLVHRVAGR